MTRRELMALLGGAVAWPLAARAQQPTQRLYKIGYLQIASREQQLHLLKAFEDGLQSLGYRVGDNVVIEPRFAHGELARLPALAADLVQNRRGHHRYRKQSQHACGYARNHDHPDRDDHQHRPGQRRARP